MVREYRGFCLRECDSNHEVFIGVRQGMYWRLFSLSSRKDGAKGRASSSLDSGWGITVLILRIAETASRELNCARDISPGVQHEEACLFPSENVPMWVRAGS